MKNQIRKRTAIAHILAIIALPFFVYLGYKNSNWLMGIVCLVGLLFVVCNAYKYFFKIDYRKHLNEYHNQQDALPWRERDMYRLPYGKITFFLIIITSLLLFIATVVCVKFNLL